MKIVVRNSETNQYICEDGTYTCCTEQARDFESITQARQFCRARKLHRHAVLLISKQMVVSEMNLGDC